MRVLIVRLGAFGDIIHTLPLAADLHGAGHEVGWLCEDRWAELVNKSPVITSVHCFPRAVMRAPTLPFAAKYSRIRDLFRDIRSVQYDAVIDAQGLAKSATLTLLTGVHTRIAHARPRAREGSWLAARRLAPVTATHVIDQQRALALPLGVRASGGWKFSLPTWTEEHCWARMWLTEVGALGGWLLNVGAGWPTKVWPLPRQIELAQSLRNSGIPLVVAWGNPAEHHAAKHIISEAAHGFLAPKTSIPQLAGLIAATRMVISGDTGPLHLALALGTPAIGLFGPVPAERNGPRGRGYRTLQAPAVAWERRDVSKVDMGAISANAVITAANEALSERTR